MKFHTTQPLVYVAGPFRGKHAYEIERNIRAAEDMGLLVCEWGAVATIPHTMFRYFQGALPDEFWLKATLNLLRRCDAIVLLSNWEKSSGAKGEAAEAQALGMPIFLDRTSFSAIAPVDVRATNEDMKDISLKDWIAKWRHGPEEVRRSA